MALFNSSLLNYWYARQYENVHVTPAYFRQLPIFPADTDTQAEFIALVDELLAQHAALNVLREQDYVIRTRRDGTHEITVPYDVLLRDLQTQDRNFPVVSLFDARAMGLLNLPAECDTSAQIGRVFTPTKFPNTVVLRANQLWLNVDDTEIRRYLLNYLARPRWQSRTWDDISDRALLPEPPAALTTLFAEEARIVAEIHARLDAIAAADAALDTCILDLYGITDPADCVRILGSASPTADADTEESVEVED